MRSDGVRADLLVILDYLGLGPDSDDMARIAGLDPAVIGSVLEGTTLRTERDDHISEVARVVVHLGDVRAAVTGTRRRGTGAHAWLREASVVTSNGERSPLEILSDPVATREQLDAMSH